MLSPKLKWPREASCIPNSTLQPISDQRTRSALNKQVDDLFLIQNAQSAIKELGWCMLNLINRSLTYFSFRTKTYYSSVFNCFLYGQFWIFNME